MLPFPSPLQYRVSLFFFFPHLQKTVVLVPGRGPQQKLAGDADERSRPLKTTQAVYPSTCKDDAVNPGEHHLGGGGQREAATVLLPPNAALETRGPGITVSSRSFPGTSESDSFKRLNFKRLATNFFF